MTGANRLLIGIGWSMVVFIAWYRSPARGAAGDPTRSGSSASALHRDRVPRPRDPLLADAAAEAHDHAGRRRGAGRASSSPTRCAAPDGAGRGAAPGRAGALHRHVPDAEPAGRRSSRCSLFAAAVILLCAEPFAESLVATGEEFGDQRVPARAVARAARVGGARAARGRPVRVAAQHERGSRHAGVVEGEPVDAARRHAADRVRDRRRAACTGCRSTRTSARSCSSPRRSRSSRSPCWSRSRSRSREALDALRAVLGAVRDRRHGPRVRRRASSASWWRPCTWSSATVDLRPGTEPDPPARPRRVPDRRTETSTGARSRASNGTEVRAARARTIAGWTRRRSSSPSTPRTIARPRARASRVRATEPGPFPDDLPELIVSGSPCSGSTGCTSTSGGRSTIARSGRNVIMATGTASGKTLVYNLAFASEALPDPKRTALYLFPTKALARDQLRQVRELKLPQLKAARVRRRHAASRTPADPQEREPGHDEPGHAPRGDPARPRAVGRLLPPPVARGRGRGARVPRACSARTSRTCCGGSDGWSRTTAAIRGSSLRAATVGNPVELAERLVGVPFDAVTEDASPRAGQDVRPVEPAGDRRGVRRPAERAHRRVVPDGPPGRGRA